MLEDAKLTIAELKVKYPKEHGQFTLFDWQEEVDDGLIDGYNLDYWAWVKDILNTYSILQEGQRMKKEFNEKYGSKV